MNLEIRQFEEQLVRLYNSSNVPAEAKRLALLEVLHKAEEVSSQLLSKELAERKKKEQEDMSNNE